jgi:hypothetical protein
MHSRRCSQPNEISYGTENANTMHISMYGRQYSINHSALVAALYATLRMGHAELWRVLTLEVFDV